MSEFHDRYTYQEVELHRLADAIEDLTRTLKALLANQGDSTATDDDPHDLMVTSEVAEKLRVPQETVRYWRHMGTGPKSFKVGRRVLYERTEVERWFSDRRAGNE